MEKYFHHRMLAVNLRHSRFDIPYSASGQSLFEVIFAIGVAALVLVGILSLSTMSLRNSTFSKNNSLATKYAQEATEWIRQERDANWTNISTRIGTTCISNPPAWGGGCALPGGFSRSVILSNAGTDIINAVVIVTWTDGQGEHTVRSSTSYSNWR